MTESETRKTLSLGGAKPKLELKKPVDPAGAGAAGVVKQSFSHGRTKAVAVEVKRKRDGAREIAAATSVRAADSEIPPMGGAARQLTNEEREARARALRGAATEGTEKRAWLQHEEKSAAPSVPEDAAPVDEALPMDAESLRRRELEELRRIQEHERLESEQRKKDEDQRRATDTKTTTAKRTETTVAGRGAALVGRSVGTDEEDDSSARRRRGSGGGGSGRGVPTPPPRTRSSAGDDRRGGGRMTLQRALSGDEGERTYSVAAMRRRIEREKRQFQQAQEQQQKIARDVVVPETITVQELANRMAERGADVIKALMKLGIMATITQTIDADTAELVAGEFGHKVKRVTEADVEIGMKVEDNAEDLRPRPPVVTIMGHVDHGKTSLLDALRHANVVAGEAGGITQHIGAYQVILPQALHGFDRITFIDTPGHAAFTEMRARGANVTDIVILVVAADDGIMPQTIEAIRHAKAAAVPMIVAINKCDLPAANPNRVRQELLQHDVQVEEMGGDVLSVEISAKTKTGLDKLQEAILLQAEILDLKANPKRTAEGVVVEAKMERGRGSVATVLIQRGTLKIGEIFVAGGEWGRVRALIDDRGQNVQEAGPAMPVEVLGLNATPQAGDEFVVVENDARAREISEFRQRKKRAAVAAAAGRGSLEQMLANIQSGQAKELPVLIKGDVHGSIEAIKGALEKLAGDNTEVRVRVLDAAVGPITESDVTLANASKGMIVGFNVRANPQAREMAKRDGVEIRYYSIIYNVIDDVKQALSGLLSPTLREKFLGNAEILQVFNITKVGKVAGCKVTEGIVKRGAKVRLLRDNVVIHEGALKTLKRLKDEVKEVREGYECGMAFENYDNIEAGDVIECFELEEIARQI